MALDIANEIISTVVRTSLEIWIFSPRRKGKIRDQFSRNERIERIYDWREANDRRLLVRARPL